MPRSPEPRADRRPQSRKRIDDMLRERQQMLVLLWELSKCDFDKADRPLFETLEEFQEILVDYIAAGHFGLYQRIVEGNERRAAVIDAARETYPRIARSTDAAVDFTDRYETPDAALVRSKLSADLSRLAEEISGRIELEDRLILAMLGTDFTIPESGVRI